MRDAIDVFCRTNLDKGRQQLWPNKMAARPVIGDSVRSKSGLELRIVSIIHKMSMYAGDGGDTRPVLEVELHLPEGMSISEWEGGV